MIEQPTSRAEPAPGQPADDLWRKEIHSRIAGYRQRRARRVAGASSMRFSFPPTAPQESAPAADLGAVGELTTAGDAFGPVLALAAEPAPALQAPPESSDSAALPAPQSEPEFVAEVAEAEDIWLAPDEAPEPDPPPAPPRPARPRGKRKIIAFPRQPSLVSQVYHYLADPIVPDQPRILDVPEELELFPAAPLLDGLHLPASHEVTTPAEHIELPFQAVNISRRLCAGLVDCALVAAGATIFGAVSYRLLPKMAAGKPVLLAAGAVLGLFWAVYQYVFTLYRCATPGMLALHLRLRTFKGERLSWRHRRSRVFGLYFSTASLMMGLLWGLVDVDGLCWHDRVSRTYLSERE
jgi:uncharacterized RDD family membrane protein YckC